MKIFSQKGKSAPILQKIQVFLPAITAIWQEIWNHLNCVPRKSDKKKHLAFRVSYYKGKPNHAAAIYHVSVNYMISILRAYWEHNGSKYGSENGGEDGRKTAKFDTNWRPQGTKEGASYVSVFEVWTMWCSPGIPGFLGLFGPDVLGPMAIQQVMV